MVGAASSCRVGCLAPFLALESYQAGLDLRLNLECTWGQLGVLHLLFISLKHLLSLGVMSGIGGAAITTNRNVSFPISINGIQVQITALILPKHCPFMPRVIIGLSTLVHKLGGVGFLPNSEAYGDKSRVTVGFPNWAPRFNRSLS